MSAFRIEAIGQEELDRVQALLSGVEGGMDKAVREALSRAASHLRTTSVKAIREKYAISAAGIRDNETISISNLVGAGGNQVWIKFAGKKIPLYRYDGAAPATPTQDTSRWVMAVISGQERWVHPGVAARGHVRKDTSSTQFESAFVAKMRSGHVGIFERTGGKTASGGDAIRELMGLSVPQMLGNEEVQESLAKDAMKVFQGRLEHNVTAILSGIWR